MILGKEENLVMSYDLIVQKEPRPELIYRVRHENLIPNHIDYDVVRSFLNGQLFDYNRFTQSKVQLKHLPFGESINPQHNSVGTLAATSLVDGWKTEEYHRKVRDLSITLRLNFYQGRFVLGALYVPFRKRGVRKAVSSLMNDDFWHGELSFNRGVFDDDYNFIFPNRLGTFHFILGSYLELERALLG